MAQDSDYAIQRNFMLTYLKIVHLAIIIDFSAVLKLELIFETAHEVLIDYFGLVLQCDLV